MRKTGANCVVLAMLTLTSVTLVGCGNKPQVQTRVVVPAYCSQPLFMSPHDNLTRASKEAVTGYNEGWEKYNKENRDKIRVVE